MLNFTHDQFYRLSNAQREAFGAEAWKHLREHYGECVTRLGETRSREFLQDALGQGAALGFESRSDALKYVNLFFEFGPEFATAPCFDWARTIIDSGLPNRMDLLYAAAVEALFDKS